MSGSSNSAFLVQFNLFFVMDQDGLTLEEHESLTASTAAGLANVVSPDGIGAIAAGGAGGGLVGRAAGAYGAFIQGGLNSIFKPNK